MKYLILKIIFFLFISLFGIFISQNVIINLYFLVGALFTIIIKIKYYKVLYCVIRIYIFMLLDQIYVINPIKLKMIKKQGLILFS